MRILMMKNKINRLVFYLFFYMCICTKLNGLKAKKACFDKGVLMKYSLFNMCYLDRLAHMQQTEYSVVYVILFNLGRMP